MAARLIQEFQRQSQPEATTWATQTSIFWVGETCVITKRLAEATLFYVERTMSRAETLDQMFYPESDGKPMGETDLHIEWMFRIREIMRW